MMVLQFSSVLKKGFYCIYNNFTIIFYRLNLPNCLPSVYVSMKDPPQAPSGKGLLGLFSSSPSVIDQNLLCMFF